MSPQAPSARLSDEESIEEQLLDTDYSWKHHPSSVMVIPGGERNAVYMENFETMRDKEAVIRLAEQILCRLGPNPAVATPPGGPDPANEKQLRAQCRRLQVYMIDRKAYRNHALSLAGLAKATGIPQRTISDALNSCLGQNFSSFINSYRIDAVKQAMIDPENEDRTLLEIAYSQGFNSKSTFNEVFRRQMGMTPSAYREARTSPARARARSA